MKLLVVLFLFSFSLSLDSCRSQKIANGSGLVYHQVRHYDTLTYTYTQPSILPDIKIWHKDNLVIQEIKSISTHTDTFGVTTIERPLEYYLFIDRNSRTFYEYSSFSDTARILNSYFQADSAEIRGKGGWRFYASTIHYTNLSSSPSDTIIKEIRYKRITFILQQNKNQSPAIGYLRCDKKGNLFQFEKNITNQTGCPMVRFDFLPTAKEPFPVSVEVVFVRDSLSKEELKVFNAWEKNTKKYPVTMK